MGDRRIAVQFPAAIKASEPIMWPTRPAPQRLPEAP